MTQRSEALKLAEKFQALVREEGASVEVAMRAFAMQAVILERVNPEMWAIAVEDALEGMSLAMPETEQ